MRNEPKVASDPEMLPDYDFTDGVRGKHAVAFGAGDKLVLLEPDVAEVFPDAQSVNRFLRALAGLARDLPPRLRG